MAKRHVHLSDRFVCARFASGFIAEENQKRLEMTALKDLNRRPTPRPEKAKVTVENYPELPASVGEKLREKYRDAFKKARVISEVTW